MFFWPNIEKRDLVECILCGRQMTGGINRIKQHRDEVSGTLQFVQKQQHN